MPLELGIWRIDQKLVRLEVGSLDLEERLESILEQEIDIASPNWMIIGRQVYTDYGKFIDLLAVNRDGNLVVLELKKSRTPREVVAQLLDYGSWVKNLKDDRIVHIYSDYHAKYHPDRTKSSFDEDFRQRFKVAEAPEELNSAHELVIVASALDDSTERIVSYLAEQQIPINAVFFRVFKDGESEYIARAWLIDPTQPVESSIEGSVKEIWNGEFYVSFGEGEHRKWSDAVKYGFISAGHGSWYSKTLFMLQPGNRVWVNVPQTGYVGVGEVAERAVKVDQFLVSQPDGSIQPITKLQVSAPLMFDKADDEEKAEYLVPVRWIKTVPIEEAIKEKGFFGNQNTVCKPTAKQWHHTVERLKKRFDIP